jgi:acid phosphatase (class A)
MKRRLWAVIPLLAATSLFFAATPAASSSKDVAEMLTRPLPPPPNDSAQTKAELAWVLTLQSTRTDADIARAKVENTPSLTPYAEVIGPWFTKEKLPKTYTLFANLTTQGFDYCNAVKPDYVRPRPATVDPRIKPLFEETDSSYPSGHAISSMLFALVLSDLLPDLKPQIIARAQQIGFDRVLAGMHYPSDITAGQYIGQMLARTVYSNQDFKADLAAARAELATRRPGKQP